MSEEIKTPPHNDDAERALLAAILIDNRIWAAVAPRVKATDFYRPSHRMLFESFERLFKAGRAFDVITVWDDLIDAGHAGPGEGKLNDVSWLVRIGDELPSAANFGHYLEIVIEKSARRRYIAELRAITAGLYDDGGTSAEVGQRLTKLVASLAPPEQERAVRGGKPLVDDYTAAELAKISPIGGGTSTGVEPLDRMIGGVWPSRSIYLGGLSKRGKTALAVNIAAHLALVEGWAVEFLSCEMSHAELMERFVAWDSGIDMKRYYNARRYVEAAKAGIVPPFTHELEMDLRHLEDWIDRVEHSKSRIGSSGLRITSRGRPNAHVFALQCKARQLHIEANGGDGTRLFVVADYLQAFITGTHKVDEDEPRRVQICSSVLNGISKELAIPVLIPFQFTKEAERQAAETGRAPSAHHARGSSQISNDANELIIYDRPFFKSDDPKKKSYARIVSELSRAGVDVPIIHLHADLARNIHTTWNQDVPTDEEIEQMARSSRTGGMSGREKNEWQAKGSFRSRDRDPDR